MPQASGPKQSAKENLIFAYDIGDVKNSYIGEPTTNLVPNADVMSSWTNYYRTLASSTFTTEFGTTGYRFVNQPTWNGIYRTVNLSNTGTYTFSAWFKYNGGSASNNGATVYISNYGGGDTLAGLDKSLIGVWQRVTHTISVSSPSNVYFYLISYGGVDSGTGNPDYSSWEVTMPQIELNSHTTSFINGTRSATQGLKPIVGNSSIDLTNVSFDSNSKMYFDGTNDYIDLGYAPFSGTGDFTIDTVYTLNTLDTHTIIGNYPASSLQFMGRYGLYINGACYFPSYLGPGTYHATATRESGVCKLYLNGTLVNTVSNGNNIGTNSFVMGKNTSGGEVLNGAVPVLKLYNKALTATEVTQNYKSYKTRFKLA